MIVCHFALPPIASPHWSSALSLPFDSRPSDPARPHISVHIVCEFHFPDDFKRVSLDFPVSTLLKL
ncbi:hypothetical protein I7I52_10679 [Histoplasma capsulatum]|uniref:Uncharacterized protein n=1 Tax=Ajellomyces capsulatus TaxID=5037 RepID=A0A8H8D550_AJECA|nr:hypothetical protein I7I52_10679 [Histoplasma capsulatum]